MTAPHRMLAALAAVLTAALTLSACGGSLPANDVAEVGSTQISKQEAEHWVRIIVAQATRVPARQAPVPVAPEYNACIANLHVAQAAERSQAEKHGETPNAEPTHAEEIAQCEQKLTTDRQAALGALLSNVWLSGEAQRIGATVTEAELNKEFEALKKEGFGSNEKAFKEYLANNGYTLADVKMKTRDELLKKALTKKLLTQAAHKPIPHDEIEDFYEEHEKYGEHPESKGLNILLVQTEAEAKAAKSEIQSGKSFKSVAGRVSIYHTGGNGVYLTALRKHLPAALEEEIWSLKRNVLTGPFHTEQGYFVLELKKTTPASKESLQQAEESIKYAITTGRTEHVGKHFPEEFEARWRAITTCRSGWISKQCKEFAPKVAPKVAPKA